MSSIPDERLSLIFTCCHPLPERLSSVLAVLYLIFNEGYSNVGQRQDLCNEALRLGRVLCTLMPDEREAYGLLALMLLQDSRRDARITADGSLVLLEEQDRSSWDASEIAEGIAALERAMTLRGPGLYQLQAAIASVHAQAQSAEATDWPTIVALYGRLACLAPSPVVELNRAVAVAMASGPEEGLRQVEALAPELDSYHLLHATRADLLRRLGRPGESAAAYRRALELAAVGDRAFLEQRLAEVSRKG